ncbi:MAG: hypothetical protein IT426_09360 [Pirellulales bacterium]|nr:hypothetical protein [Pirellulales bacterium]
MNLNGGSHAFALRKPGDDGGILADDAGGQPTIEKVRPILFSPRDRKYHGVGKFLGKAFEAGRGLMKK